MAMTFAERQAAYIARLKAGVAPKAPIRRPNGRRIKPKQWAEALAVLESLLDGWQDAHDNLPESLADGAYGSKLDDVLELREHVEALIAADLPRGFDRD